jgi:hypothetical protein
MDFAENNFRVKGSSFDHYECLKNKTRDRRLAQKVSVNKLLGLFLALHHTFLSQNWFQSTFSTAPLVLATSCSKSAVWNLIFKRFVCNFTNPPEEDERWRVVPSAAPANTLHYVRSLSWRFHFEGGISHIYTAQTTDFNKTGTMEASSK